MRSGSRSGLLIMAAIGAGVLTIGLAAAPAGGATSVTSRADGTRVTGKAAGNPFCAKAGVRYLVSAGADGFCFGAQPEGSSGGLGSAAVPRSSTASAPSNVNAASLSEDINPAGVRSYGQAEVSIASAGKYVVEAWNDSTGFYTVCGASENKEEFTGFGFSANGGKSFTDLGGLPNRGCAKYLYEGDPAVAAYQAGGKTYFYVASLFDQASGAGASEIAMSACQVTGVHLSCGQPVVIGRSTHCVVQGGTQFCDFLDKDFIAIDPVRHRLYASYTDFPNNGTTDGTNIDATACDLSTPATPVCESNVTGAAPYENLAKASASACENEGAYPAVDAKTGDLYVTYQFNAGSNLGYAPCITSATPTTDVLVRVPFACLTLTSTAKCGVSQRAGVKVTSLEAAPIPGYSRFPVPDFPRLAVSDRYGTVSLVWNDTRYHVLGDILLQSFNLGNLTAVQRTPVILDKPIAGGLNFLPGLRMSTGAGKLDVTWFSRSSGNTADTNVYAAMDVNPRTTAAPARDVRITNVASDWLSAVSDINPNFGDYTDNYVDGGTLYVAWSDGRLGITQPFEAHLPA